MIPRAAGFASAGEFRALVDNELEGLLFTAVTRFELGTFGVRDVGRCVHQRQSD
jgi:hypothetical protein